ncbi:MAG: alkaline phosphatase family protein [Actinomycetes bacterium]
MKLPAVAALAALALSASVAGTASAAARPGGLEGIPHLDHVVVLVEENESEATTFGPGSPAQYLNSLQAKGVFDPQYFGTGHVSLDNYIAMVSGQPGNGLTNSDCETVSLYTCAQSTRLFANGRHLGDQLDEAQVTWKSYMDGTSTPCFHGPYSSRPPAVFAPDPYQGNSQAAPGYDYADRHNPFIYFPDFVGDEDRCAAHQRPIDELATDVAADTLPAFSFITPDTCHDGHDAPCANGQPGGLVSADAWLRQHVPALLKYLNRHNGLLAIVFDEAEPPDSGPCSQCVSGGLGGQVGALFLSRHLPQGTVVDAPYDHDSLLRTIEDSFGISEHLNLADRAAPMTSVFAGYH